MSDTPPQTEPDDATRSTQQAIAPTFIPKGLQADQLMSFAALILSIFALGVALFEANTQRIQQRAEIWPYARIAQGFSQNGYEIRILNKGVGPALIQQVELRYQGERYSDLDDLIGAVMEPDQIFSYELYRTSNPLNSVISANEEVQIFGVPWDSRTRVFADRFSADGDFKICYCSILEECWVHRRFDQEGPQPVPACPVDD